MLKKQIDTMKGRWKLAEGWSWRMLEEVADVQVGYKKAKEDLQSPEGTIPLIVSGDLQNRQAIDISRYVTEEEYQRLIANHGNIRQQDSKQKPERKLLIAAARETAGRIGILEAKQALFNSAVIAIMPKEQIQLEYLYYYFLMEGTRKYIQRTFLPGPRPRITNEDFQQTMPIPVPNWKQKDTGIVQERVIERIETLTQTAREGRTQITVLQTNLLNSFTSTLEQLFSSERANKWSRIALSEVVDIVQPEEKLEQREMGQYAVIEPDKIISCIGTHNPYKDSSQLSSSQRKNYYLLEERSATLLYVLLRPAAKRAVLFNQERVLYNSDIVALRVKNPEGLLPSFLLYSLLGADFTRFMLNNLTGAIVARGQAEQISHYRLPLPPIEEQRSLISYLDEVQRQTHIGQATLEKDAQWMSSAENEILEHAFRGDL